MFNLRLDGPTQARETIRERARHRVGSPDQYRPHYKRRAGIRSAEDEPLAHGIYEDAHEHQVRHALEAAPHQLAPQASLHDYPVQIRWPSRPCVSQAIADAEDNGGQRLQDEAKATGAGEPFGDVLEERPRKQVKPPAVIGVT